MEKQKNSPISNELGYDLFAREGWQHIQAERLARILRLNKSGFYHYFGDLACFSIELVNIRKKNINIFLQEVREIKNLDPDYLLLLVKHAATVMFQVQLTRHRRHQSFYEVSERIDQLLDLGVRQLWLDFIGMPAHAELVMRYYYMVRDMFYTRATFQNLNFPFLHDLVKDSKIFMNKIRACKTLVTNESLPRLVNDSV